MIKVLLILIVLGLAVYGAVEIYEDPEEAKITYNGMITKATSMDIFQQCLPEDIEKLTIREIEAGVCLGELNG